MISGQFDECLEKMGIIPSWRIDMYFVYIFLPRSMIEIDSQTMSKKVPRLILAFSLFLDNF